MIKPASPFWSDVQVKKKKKEVKVGEDTPDWQSVLVFSSISIITISLGCFGENAYGHGDIKSDDEVFQILQDCKENRMTLGQLR